MVSHTNFYETIQEARMRLDETVVLYDGEPYHLLTVCNHKPDGIFRVYLDPMVENGMPWHRLGHVPYHSQDGNEMDTWLDSTDGKKSPVLRKMMNSPKFNKFRPFALGMLNSKNRAFYTERTPTRHTQQGLTGSSISALAFDLIDPPGLGNKKAGQIQIGLNNAGLYSTIKGTYPSLDSVLTNLTDDTIENTSVGFHREFAIVRGPMGMLFVAYKGDIVGFLPYNNTSEIKVSPKHSYVKEVVDELACFNKIS